MSNSIDSLQFTNTFSKNMPADPITDNRRRQTPDSCFSRVQPKKSAAPELLAWSSELAKELGIDDPSLSEATKNQFTNVFSGNHILPDMDPYAMCYGGHQFGNWAGQLGDGRAINLGEITVPDSSQHYTLQLKGSGPTPYSRNADGLAVMRSSIREFLCSEAMYHLGIPTTRALSLIGSGDWVERDMFYDGHTRDEPGAIVCRTAPSFVRFGNFEILASRGETDNLRRLAEHVIVRDFPHLGKPDKSIYAAWFDEVCQLTAKMIVGWMRVGFVHGVMNTDNMSVLGLTIDYGPYGWLEGYQPDWTPNTTDAQNRRYRYENQPNIALWNLAQLGNALYPLIEDIESLQKSIDHFKTLYATLSDEMMANKLGFAKINTPRKTLIEELQSILQLTETDMTIFYRNLAKVDSEAIVINSVSDEVMLQPVLDAYYTPEKLSPEITEAMCSWLKMYAKETQASAMTATHRQTLMNRTNPKYVLRNYISQQVIDDTESGNLSKLQEVLELIKRPYDEQPDKQAYFAKRPEWARNKAGCSMLSCSS